jgi:NADH:ubiquinone oxidoreductase subunit 6 (subunit J)
VTALTLAAYVVLAVLALVSAVVVVWHRNPVVAALALAFNLVSIAGFYLVMDAQFLALLQVIVYAGAIMVLILFVIMLLNLRQELRGGTAASCSGCSVRCWPSPSASSSSGCSGGR